jgi:hypothetical protein
MLYPKIVYHSFIDRMYKIIDGKTREIEPEDIENA